MNIHQKIFELLKRKAKIEKKSCSRKLNQIYNDLAIQEGYQSFYDLQQRVHSEKIKVNNQLDNFSIKVKPILLNSFPPNGDYSIEQSVDWSKISTRKPFDERPLDFLIYYLDKPILAIHIFPNHENDPLFFWVSDKKTIENFFDGCEIGFLGITTGYLEIFRKKTLLEWQCECFAFCYHVNNGDDYKSISDFDSDPFWVVGWDVKNQYPNQIAMENRLKLRQLHNQKITWHATPQQETKSTKIFHEALTYIQLNEGKYAFNKCRMIGCNLFNLISEYVEELGAAILIERFLKKELQSISTESMFKIIADFKPDLPGVIHRSSLFASNLMRHEGTP